MLKMKWIRFWNNSLVVSIEIFLLLIFINIICMNNGVFLPLDEGWYVEIAWFEKMNCATLAMKEDILSFVVVVPVLRLRQLRQPFLNKTWMRWTYCNDNKISTGSSFAIHQRHGNVQECPGRVISSWAAESAPVRQILRTALIFMDSLHMQEVNAKYLHFPYAGYLRIFREPGY